MNRPLILLSSITYAMKARDLLWNMGFRAYIERVARNRDTGCGYAVYVPDNTDMAEQILDQEGFKILGRAPRGGYDI